MDVKSDFSRSGKSADRWFIVEFNSNFGAERRNTHWHPKRFDTREKTETCKKD